MKLIFLGPPGAGKGTYAQRICPKFNIPQISTGDLCRAKAKEDTEFGRKIKATIESGVYVDDITITEMLKERISQPDCANGFILDGYPRTIPQAEMLSQLTNIDKVILLNVPEDVLIARLTSRRTCRNCNKIYNVLTLKPKVEGKCDACGGEIYQRADETESVIKHRLGVYLNQTAPLVEYYNAKGLIGEVHNSNPNAPPEEIVPKILEHLPVLIKVKREPGCEDLPLPAYQSAGAAGMDLHAAVEKPVILKPGDRIKISTGLRFEVPEDYEMQVRPRGGLADKNGVVAYWGTVDWDYRGILQIILFNHGQEPLTINRGDRIAQMVVAKVEKIKLAEVKELSETKRGAGGFGSTGVSEVKTKSKKIKAN